MVGDDTNLLLMVGGDTNLFLMVGDDTADKVGVGVAQRGHQLVELFLVQLADSAEHSLACA